MLNKNFSGFDDLSSKYSIEKIKMIGDIFFAFGGLKNDSMISAKNLISMAKEMIAEISNLNIKTEKMDIQVRIGIHCGDVVTGVISKHKFAYEL